MDLNKIYYFQEVASLGGISQASRKLNISQPALSLQIKGLEDQLGHQLFVRANKKLKLTPLGENLYQKAKELKDWKVSASHILSEEDILSGEISIGTYTTASSYLLAKTISKFQKEYSGINFKYNYENTDKIVDKILNYELDCAILSGVPISESLEKHVIYKTEMILVASHQSKIKSKIKGSEISQYNFLSYSIPNDYCYIDIHKRYGKYIKKSCKPIISENFETLKQGVVHNSGITFVPRYIVREELISKKIKEVKIIDSRSIPVNIELVIARKRSHNKRTECWLNFIKDFNF